MQEGATVSAADVARLAGVGRAAVSNWRRRYEDFPAPVAGTASSPVFSLADIEGWLRSQGKLLAEVPAEERVWQGIRASSDDLRLAEAVADMGGFLLYLQRAPQAWADIAKRGEDAVAGDLTEALGRTLHDLPGGPPVGLPRQASLLREVADLAASWGVAETFDFLYARYLDAHSRSAAVTPAGVADLMAALADVRHGAVLDPACGSGALLRACLPYGAARVVGQEREAASARIAAVSLLLREACMQVAAGDSLRDDGFPELRADAVLCDLPPNERSWGYEELAGDPRWEFGLPPRGEPELAWLQHALARARPGARVVMLMPAAVASRRSGRRLRAELLRSGALRGIVALPVSAAPAATAPYLWLLRRPERDDRPPARLLMADVAGFGGSWQQLRETVERSWQAYLTDPEAAPGPPDISAAVSLIELLDDEVDLTPARRLSRPAADSGAEFAGARDQLAATVAELTSAIPGLTEQHGEGRDSDGQGRQGATAWSLTTVGEQVKAGTLAIHQSPLRMEGDTGDRPLLTAQDVTLGRAASGTVAYDAGQITLQEGDVVMPAVTRQVAVRVISAGGEVLGPHLSLLRPDTERYDPDFLAGFLRIAGRASATRSSSGSSRVDIRKVRFPRLPIDEQRRYGTAFRQLAALEEASHAITELTAAVVRAGLDGLGEGTLQPPP